MSDEEIQQAVDGASKEILRVYEAERLYYELLMAVGNVYPNETRHQTALRYILQAERQTSGPDEAKCSQPPNSPSA